MEIQTIETDIIHFLEKNILAENVKIFADSHLREVGVDSFSIVEIILFIERKYGFVIPDDELIPDNFKTINSISQVVFEIGTKL
jgi:acyl carrier protein